MLYIYYFLDSHLISKLHATSALHNTDLTSQCLLAFGNASIASPAIPGTDKILYITAGQVFRRNVVL